MLKAMDSRGLKAGVISAFNETIGAKCLGSLLPGEAVWALLSDRPRLEYLLCYLYTHLLSVCVCVCVCVCVLVLGTFVSPGIKWS